MSEIKNSGLDQYGAEPFEQQQFGTAGVEGVKLKIGVPVLDYTKLFRKLRVEFFCSPVFTTAAHLSDGSHSVIISTCMYCMQQVAAACCNG